MKLLANLAIALVLTSAQPVWAQDIAAQTVATGIKIIDARPDKQRKLYAMSHMIFNCSYGVYNLADDLPGTNRIGDLQKDLQAAFGERLANEAVTVKSYAVILNAQAMVEDNATVGGFAAAGVIVQGGSNPAGKPTVVLAAKCPQDKMPSGWFATSEITDNYPPLVVEMVVTVKGKDYVTRSVYSPGKIDFTKGYQTPVMATAVNAAVHKANQALIEQMRVDFVA